MNAKVKEHVDHLRRLVAGPMSEDEVAFLRDIQGMIEFSIRNGVHFAVVLSAILHDLIEIRQADGSLEKAKALGFQPKVTGYAAITSDSFGGEDEPIE